MTSIDAAATVEANLAFARFHASHGVTIKHYYCDNGLYGTKKFKASINTASQTISFCGLNAHHQNGKSENMIKDLTTNSRTSLIHAAHQWPDTIGNALWPATLKHYCNLMNKLPAKFIAGGKMAGRSYLINTSILHFLSSQVQTHQQI